MQGKAVTPRSDLYARRSFTPKVTQRIMSNSLLYFPFIEIESKDWLNYTLLYWDCLKSIVPFGYDFRSQTMRELSENKLIISVFPGEHIHQVPDFAPAFFEYVRNIRAGRQDLVELANSRPTPIHLEKLGPIADKLVELGWAEHGGGNWYLVNQWMANRVMTYIATCLGQLESVDSTPITDDAGCYRALSGRNVGNLPLIQRLLRQLVVLPQGKLNFEAIKDFKIHRGEQLLNFRKAIEQKCDEINRRQPEDQIAAADAAVNELKTERDAIVRAMKLRWFDVGAELLTTPASLTLLLSPKSDIQQRVYGLAGLAGAIYKACRRYYESGNVIRKPMSYAALANKKFSRK